MMGASAWDRRRWQRSLQGFVEIVIAEEPEGDEDSVVLLDFWQTADPSPSATLRVGMTIHKGLFNKAWMTVSRTRWFRRLLPAVLSAYNSNSV